jgi:tRNA-splicing ligase RtcB
MKKPRVLMADDHSLILAGLRNLVEGEWNRAADDVAKRTVRGEQLQQQMKKRGILVKAVSMSGLAKDDGLAYKNITHVVESVDRAGITKWWWNWVPLVI